MPFNMLRQLSLKLLINLLKALIIIIVSIALIYLIQILLKFIVDLWKICELRVIANLLFAQYPFNPNTNQNQNQNTNHDPSGGANTDNTKQQDSINLDDYDFDLGCLKENIELEIVVEDTKIQSVSNQNINYRKILIIVSVLLLIAVGYKIYLDHDPWVALVQEIPLNGYTKKIRIIYVRKSQRHLHVGREITKDPDVSGRLGVLWHWLKRIPQIIWGK